MTLSFEHNSLKFLDKTLEQAIINTVALMIFATLEQKVWTKKSGL